MTRHVLVGKRIELVSTSDLHTNLHPRDRGTITVIDSLGTVHAGWDDGSTLGLMAEAGDRWRIFEGGRVSGYVVVYNTPAGPVEVD